MGWSTYRLLWHMVENIDRLVNEFLNLSFVHLDRNSTHHITRNFNLNKCLFLSLWLNWYECISQNTYLVCTTYVSKYRYSVAFAHSRTHRIHSCSAESRIRNHIRRGEQSTHHFDEYCASLNQIYAAITLCFI